MNIFKKHIPGYAWLFIKIIISAALITYLLVTISVNDIISALKSVNILLFLAALLLTIPINYLSAYQTHYLTKVQGMSITVLQILKVHLITTYYSLFLPGILSGGAVKWYKFSKYGNRSSAAAVVVLNRFIETFITVLLGIIFFMPGRFEAGDKSIFFILIIILISLFILYILLINKSINRVLVSALHKHHVPKIIKNKLHNFLSAMSDFRTLSFMDHVKINGIVVFYNLIGTLSFYYFAKSMSIDLDLLTIGWIRSALGIISLLPFSFAGLGIREGGLVVLLGQYEVLPQSAMALSFLLFMRNLLTAFLGGILELIPTKEKINPEQATTSDLSVQSDRAYEIH